ncbi:MAG TPA: TetR/AcrR family transcriptional regulator [Solirubrobacteraceae bacterium]
MSRDTERAILDATERLLATVPAHELNVEQILAEAGVSRRTFYAYFASKYAVITRLLERVMEEMYAVIQPFVARADDEPRKDALRHSLRAGWDVWAQHAVVLRAMHEHSHEVPELRAMWMDIIDRFAAAFSREIDRERAEGLAPPGADSAQLASILLWSSAQCAYVAGLGIDLRIADMDALFEPMLSVWLRALYGDA